MNDYRFAIVVEKDENGYFASCPELQGCYSQGETYEEAIQNIEDAIRLHVEDIRESGEVVPQAEQVSLTTLKRTSNKIETVLTPPYLAR